MSQLRKAFVMLAAAITAESFAAQVQAGESEAKAKAKASKEARPAAAPKRAAPAEKKPVAKQERARRRPSDMDMDFGMPAGSAYDVISHDDVPPSAG